MTNQNGTPGALVSRQANLATTITPPQRPMSEAMELATAMARAGDMLPKEYRNNPGSCMLAIDWSDRNGVPILDVLASVSFVNGKPLVGARLQRKLAARAGYLTRKVAGDERSCTVAVFGPEGTEVGSYTFTIEQARALKLVDRSPVWKADPAQMLWHRATTRALDHYGPADLAPLWVEDDPVTAAVRPAPAVEVVDVDADVVEAEVVDDGAVTVEDLRAAGKVVDILRTATELAGTDVTTLDDVVADQELANRVLGALQ
jgi:hypothetical protein